MSHRENLSARSIAIAISIAVTLAISLWLHNLAGITLPYPNDDENSFLLPAINLAEHNTLLAPEMNPERHIMWMPPGYMIVLGLLFKLVPFSLWFARHVSWLLAAVFYLEMCALLIRREHTILKIGFLSLVFLNTAFVAAGNEARMETMLLAIVGWAFVAFAKQQHVKAVSILTFGMLIHPNGIYFFVAIMIASWNRLKLGAQLTKSELAWLICALLAIISYSVYVGFHWTEFVNDMGFQFARKAANDHFTFLTTHRSLSILAIYYSASTIVRVRQRRYTDPLFLMGLCSTCIRVVGNEMWYEVFEGLAAACALVLVYESIQQFTVRWKATNAGVRRRILTVGSTLIPVLLAYRLGYTPKPIGFPHNMQMWTGSMPSKENVEYVKANEMESITTTINHLSKGIRAPRVLFDPTADGLLFVPRDDRLFTHIQPAFSNIQPDIVVLHSSSYLPQWHQNLQQNLKTKWGIDSNNIVVRRGNEIWYAKRLKQ